MERSTTEESGCSKDEDTPSVNKVAEPTLEGYETFEEFTKAGFRPLVEATRFANGLPSGHDWDLYMGYPSFPGIMKAEGDRILKLMQLVLKHQGIRGNFSQRSLDDQTELLIDANDVILERVGTKLDEIEGLRPAPEPSLVEVCGPSAPAPVSGSWNAAPVAKGLRLLAATNVQRPQTSFKDKVDNARTPFVPRITKKPNAIVPLAMRLEVSLDGVESYSHPYEAELEQWTVPAAQLCARTPRLPPAVDATPLVEVTTPAQLPPMLADLRKQAELAVDLEHHSYRSFQGFTCLMQISTRDTDYLVDTLALREHLHCLNEVFTDPDIVKVLHGSDHDVEWLQRDLCCYLVNMFDTHQAAKLLSMPHLSLAYLLQHYCKVSADKRFQLADWRIRPLPQELKQYAREDTHHLLYVYDLMTNQLLEAGENVLGAVYTRGVALCLKRYVKPPWDTEGHMALARRTQRLLDNRQVFALKQLYEWRDLTARQEDESTGYVLPNHMLLGVAEALPREMQGILACCNPVPPLVRQHLVQLHQMILRARDQSLVKVMEKTRPTHQRPAWALERDPEAPLHCPHDLSRSAEFRDDLPVLLSAPASATPPRRGKAVRSKRPTLSVFDVVLKISKGLPEKLQQVHFVSPYQRCKSVQPFVKAQEEEAAKKKEAEDAAYEVSKEDAENQDRMARLAAHLIAEKERLEMQPLRQQKRSRVDTVESVAKRSKRDGPEAVQVKVEAVEALPAKAQVMTSTSQSAQNPTPEKMSKRGMKRLKKANKMGEPTTFKPFDYSAVDFGAFKGGSATPSKVGKKQKKLKPKGNKKFNNKSMTYKGKK